MSYNIEKHTYDYFVEENKKIQNILIDLSIKLTDESDIWLDSSYEKIIKLIIKHFKNEETAMEFYNYENKLSHQISHRILGEWIQKPFISDKKESFNLILSHLNKHEETFDKPFFEWLKSVSP